MAVTAGTGGRLSALPQATGVSGFARDIAAIEESNLRQQQMEPDIGEATVKAFQSLDKVAQEREDRENRKALYNLQMQKAQVDYQEALRKQNLANLEDVYKQRDGVRTQAIAEVYTTVKDPEAREQILNAMGADETSRFKAETALKIFGGAVTRVDPSEVYSNTAKRLRNIREAEQAALEKRKLLAGITKTERTTPTQEQIDIDERIKNLEAEKLEAETAEAVSETEEKKNEKLFFNELYSNKGKIDEDFAKKLGDKYNKTLDPDSLEDAMAGGATTFKELSDSIRFTRKLKADKTKEGDTVFDKLKENWGIKNPGVLSGEFTSEEINKIAKSEDPDIAKWTQQIALLSGREIRGEDQGAPASEVLDKLAKKGIIESDSTPEEGAEKQAKMSSIFSIFNEADEKLPFGEAARKKIDELKENINTRLKLPSTQGKGSEFVKVNGEDVLVTEDTFDLDITKL